jgi:hypothetical protein
MYENIKNAVDLAFTGKVNDMGQEIESALMQKVADVIAGKRVEVAQSLMTPVAESDEWEKPGYMNKHDAAFYLKTKGYKFAGRSEKTGHGIVDRFEHKSGYKPAYELCVDQHYAISQHPYRGPEAVKFDDISKHLESFDKKKKQVKESKEEIQDLEEAAYHDHDFVEKNERHTRLMKLAKRQGDKESFLKHRKELEKVWGDRPHLIGKTPDTMWKESGESYIEEKLSVSDGVSAWIKDFIHSDNPRFEGKSKGERRKMAIGAFYAAKKG